MSKKLNGAVEHTTFMLVKGLSLKSFIKINRDMNGTRLSPGMRAKMG